MDKFTEVSLNTLRRDGTAQLRRQCQNSAVVIGAKAYGRILIVKPITWLEAPTSGTTVSWTQFRSASVGTLLDWRKPIVVLVYGRPEFVVEQWTDDTDS